MKNQDKCFPKSLSDGVYSTYCLKINDGRGFAKVPFINANGNEVKLKNLEISTENPAMVDSDHLTLQRINRIASSLRLEHLSPEQK